MGISSQVQESNVNASNIDFFTMENGENSYVENVDDIMLIVDTSTDNVVPEKKVVVDDKRVKLQKKISAQQREIMMLGIAKQELVLKREAIKTLEHSIAQSEKSMKYIADSMISVGTSIKEGLGLLAMSLNPAMQMQLNFPVGMTLVPNRHYQMNASCQSNETNLHLNQINRTYQGLPQYVPNLKEHTYSAVIRETEDN